MQPKSKTLYSAFDWSELIFGFLPGGTLADKIYVTELNEILLNIIPNYWCKQAYVQGFDCNSISFKNTVNIFERMEIAEYIYEDAVETSYKIYPGRFLSLWLQKLQERRIRLF